MNNNEIKILNGLVEPCLTATVEGMELVLSRFEKNEDYPFIDTKLSTITGEDFPEPVDIEADYFGKTAVFGWIQGRGLEALAGHADFFEEKNTALAERCHRMLLAVAEQSSVFKEKNERFVFLSTPEGRPFKCGEEGRREYFEGNTLPPGFADFFTGKGLAAAGERLGRKDITDMGVSTFRAAVLAVLDGSFASDQISFDPKNPAVPVPGRHPQGPFMIALGGYALLCELFPGNDEWVKGGADFLRKIIDSHIMQQDKRSLKKYDFIEFTNDKGLPFLENGKIMQDPGHALEFTGLAARFLLNASGKAAESKEFKELVSLCKELLPNVFLSAFENGFNKKAGGVCKTFDLVSRRPINDDMPWWSLPESLRSVALLLLLDPNHSRCTELVSAATECGKAFFGPFRSQLPGLFYQTRNAKGDPIPVVPATPDADPGYHTGLCLIDYIKACEKLKEISR